MPDHSDDGQLFAECLQAEATYGTLLPCEQFAPRAGREPDTGATCASDRLGAAARGKAQLFGGK